MAPGETKEALQGNYFKKRIKDFVGIHTQQIPMRLTQNILPLKVLHTSGGPDLSVRLHPDDGKQGSSDQGPEVAAGATYMDSDTCAVVGGSISIHAG